MSEFSSRKTAGGLSIARKASSRLVLKDSPETSRDRNTQICSRVGCGTKMSSSNVNHNQSPASSKQAIKSSSSSLSNPRKSRLNPCKQLSSHQTNESSKPIINNPEIKLVKPVQHDISGEASSSRSNPHSRDVKRTMRRSDLGSSLARNGASMNSFRNIKHNLGKKRINEAESSVSTRGKEISAPQLDDRRSQNLHGGISISNSTRTRNNSTFTRNDDVTSVGIQRSDPRVTRRLNEREDDLGQYSLHEIAEMLLALERIEQDEVVSYEEQWLVLETNLFLSGLSLHDQHREMRFDIDNMSYEVHILLRLGESMMTLAHAQCAYLLHCFVELLALEERMGNVSTALSEEALKKCLKKIIYHTAEHGSPPQQDEIKCSICQEEYEEGNKIGKLRCEHMYHVECIENWLKLKNWCPVCKVSAAP
ncbi:hypothetical protein V2J09_019619 [Rumex salicifolius]